MEKALAETIGEDFERQLAEYRELAAESDAIRERLQKAQRERESVKGHIFERVSAEYEARLQELDRSMQPLSAALAAAATGLSNDIAAINGHLGETEDRMEELAFRHRVGEFPDEELDRQQAPLKAEHDEMSARRRAFESKLEDIRAATPPPELREEEAEVGYDEASDEEPMDLSDLAEPMTDEFDPNYGRRIDDTPVDVVAADIEAESEASAPTRKTPPSTKIVNDHTQNLVDPTNWVDELMDPADSLGPNSDPAFAPVADSPDNAPSASKNGSTGEERREASPDNYPVLIIAKGPGAGRKLPLLPMTMTLGREHDNNIEIKDEDVARYHARISFQRGKYMLEDLESASGTWVNGERIDEVTLAHGDQIRVGATEMTIAFSTTGAISVQ